MRRKECTLPVVSLTRCYTPLSSSTLVDMLIEISLFFSIDLFHDGGVGSTTLKTLGNRIVSGDYRHNTTDNVVGYQQK